MQETDQAQIGGDDIDAEDVQQAAQIDAQSGAADAAGEPAENQERRRRKEERRLDALTWAPPGSTAVLFEDLVLGHKTVQRGFNLWFVRAQIALHKLQQELPDVASVEQVQGAMEILENQLVDIERELGDEYKRLLALASADGIETFPAKSYSHPVTLRVPLYAPGASRVLRLIRRLDDLFWALDYLYISGSLKVTHKVNLINRWKRLMWGLVQAQTKVWVRARTSLQSEGRLRGRPGRPAVAMSSNAGAQVAAATPPADDEAAPTRRVRKTPARKAPVEAVAAVG